MPRFLLSPLLLLAALGLTTSAQAQTPFPYTDAVEDPAAALNVWEPSWGGAHFVTGTAPGEVHSGTRAWRVPDGNSLTLRAPVNFANRRNPHLSVWAKAQHETKLFLEVSTDAGNTWTRIAPTSAASATEGSTFGAYVPAETVLGLWKRLQWPLDAFEGASVLLRVINNYSGYAEGLVVLDDFILDEAPAVSLVTASGATNDGFTLSWSASTAPDFERYRLVISTHADYAGAFWYEIPMPYPQKYDVHLPGVLNPYAPGGTAWRADRRVIDIGDPGQTSITVDGLNLSGTPYYIKLYVKDTQGFMNQGSPTVLQHTSEAYGLAVQAPFVEHFDTGATPPGWILERSWAVSDEADGEAAHSTPGVLSDSPDTTYARFTEQYATVRVDLSALTRPILRFRHRHAFYNALGSNYPQYDQGKVLWSKNGRDWQMLGTVFGTADWRAAEFDLSELSGASEGYIRFITRDEIGERSQEYDGWLIDDVEVADNPRTLAFPFSDDVEGTDPPWVSGMFRRQSAADARSGSQYWMSRGNLAQYAEPPLTLGGTIDLRSVDNPELSVWARAKSTGGSPNGQAVFYAYVSADGGRTWTGLSRSDGDTYVRGNVWQKLTYSLEGFQRQRVLVRFKPYVVPWGDSWIELDDFSITGGSQGAMTEGLVEFRFDTRGCGSYVPSTSTLRAVDIDGALAPADELWLTDPDGDGVRSGRYPFAMPRGTRAPVSFRIDPPASPHSPTVLGPYRFDFTGSTMVYITCDIYTQPPPYFVPGEAVSVLTVREGDATEGQKLSTGLHAEATTGLDPDLGEDEQPPFPPTGTFAARFVSNATAHLGQGTFHDLRPGTADAFKGTVVHTLKLQRATAGSDLTLEYYIPAHVRGRLQDAITGTLFDRTLVGNGTVTIPGSGATASMDTYTLTLTYGETCIDVPTVAGWNLVSAPLVAENMAASVLFPGTSNHFAYGNGYQSVTTMQPGTGYWLKSSEARTVEVCGAPVVPPVIQLQKGWNIIGGFDSAVSTTSLGGTAELGSDFFGYQNGYQPATNLAPGVGYWIKANTAGTLIFGGGTAAPPEMITRSHGAPASGEVSWLRLEVEDATGRRGALYLTPNPDGRYELPPAPPEGEFDLRFSTDRQVEDETVGVHTLQIRGATYPLTLRGVNLGGRTFILSDALRAGLYEGTLREEMSVVLHWDVGPLEVSVVADLPSEYALGQNYPNPFTSHTVIPFSLPESGHVQVRVYDVLGKLVATLADEVREAGYHEIVMGAQNLASGVYFLSLQVKGFHAVRRLTVIR